MDSPSLRFKWVAKPSIGKVLDFLVQISKDAPTNLFASKGWLQAWLQAYGETDWLLLAYDGSELVSVSLWCEKHHRRPMGFHVQTLHLHHTGDEDRDQIWTEYNGLFCKADYQPLIYQHLLDNIFNTHPYIVEVDTGLMLEQTTKLIDVSNYISEEQLSVNSYIYCARDAGTHLGFSSGLRAEINRTERGLNDLTTDNVTIDIETDSTNCWHQFQDMKELHVQAWGETSGFLNPHFMRFHEHLITNDPCDVTAYLVSLVVNGELLGRHYLLKHQETLYFYLGVTNKDVGKRIKVGTYLHAKTIEQLSHFQCVNYDFLGGDFNYKKRMATKVIPLTRNRFKKKSVKSQLERGLKRIKNTAEAFLRHD